MKRKRIKAVLLNDTSISGHLGCVLVVQQIKALAQQHDIDLVAVCPLGMHWSRLKEQILAADICIVNGEGTIHHSSKNGLSLVESAKFCKNNGVKSVLINTSTQDNIAEINANFRHFDAIYVREQMSCDYLAAQGIFSKTVPDLIFNYKIENSKLDRIQYSFNDSVYTKKTLDLIKLFTSRKKTHPDNCIFLPIENRSARIRTNNGLIKRIKSTASHYSDIIKGFCAINMVNGVPCLSTVDFLVYNSLKYANPTVVDFVANLQKSKLLVTGRYHGVCLAMLTDTPFIAISSNTFKIKSMLDEVGIGCRVVDDVKDIPTQFEQIDEFSVDKLQMIKNYIAVARTKSEKMFEEIRCLV